MALEMKLKDDLSLVVVSREIPEDLVLDQVQKNGSEVTIARFMPKQDVDRRVYLEVVPQNNRFSAQFTVGEKPNDDSADWHEVDEPICGFYVRKPDEPQTYLDEIERIVSYIRDNVASKISGIVPKRTLEISPHKLVDNDGRLDLCVAASVVDKGESTAVDLFDSVRPERIARLPFGEIVRRLWGIVHVSLFDCLCSDATPLVAKAYLGHKYINSMLERAFAQGRARPDHMLAGGKYAGYAIENPLNRLFLTPIYDDTFNYMAEEFDSVKHLPDASAISSQHMWLRDVKIK